MAKPISKESLLPPLWVLFAALLALTLWVLIELKEMVVLLVVGYSIAYIIHPILQWLERRKISRSVGVFVVLGALIIFISVMAMTAIPTIATQYDSLSQNMPSYLGMVRERLAPLLQRAKDSLFTSSNGEAVMLPTDILSSFQGDTFHTLVSGVVGALLQGYSLTMFLANLVLLPFIVYYLAVDFGELHNKILQLFPKTLRKRVSGIALEIDRYVSAFVRGQLLVCSVLFLLYGAGLWWVGVDLFFLLAVISGFGNIIPYFGFLIGIVLSSLMALVTFGDFSHVFQVWGVFAVVQFMEGFIITPRVMGEKVGFSPLTIILAIFAGGKLFGLLGIFLAIPGAAIARVLGSHFHSWFLSKSAAS